MLASSLACRSLMGLRSSAMPSVRAFRTCAPLNGAALVSPARPTKTIPSAAGPFKLERQVFIATLPLLPLSYFVHGSAMDWIVTAAIVANCHFGGHAVVTDYARPIVVGEGFAKAAHYLSYVGTALLAIVLVNFNINDVGITRAFELVFSL
ncbi:unnamed protein product [Bursaphelenchus xylophilus]|uniref:Succinate dehydrogenase [ubiquinone] cytochrome b small subunit n=1 Tax=Bursaphelenchus xylophilus TaxID=6326 RepID=A0A1I7STU9_BURXY|nr:unnamed protein product [Bursaphelenchus xylophilus]CAG9107940.1 unnamed protein product [Bursaphelenchus xylophilus]